MLFWRRRDGAHVLAGELPAVVSFYIDAGKQNLTARSLPSVPNRLRSVTGQNDGVAVNPRFEIIVFDRFDLDPAGLEFSHHLRFVSDDSISPDDGVIVRVDAFDEGGIAFK